MSTRTMRSPSMVRRIGTMVQIEAEEVMRFLSSPTGRRFRKVLAAGIILTAPAVFRIPGLRPHLDVARPRVERVACAHP
jgi:hypothetical protein